MGAVTAKTMARLAYAALFLLAFQSVLALHEDVKSLCSHAGGATFCIPKAVILGLPKCATSAMAVYLREHPELKLLHNVKEACPGGQSFDEIMSFLLVDSVAKRREARRLGSAERSNASAALYVNGCIAAYRGVPWCHEDHDHQNQCKPMPQFTSYLKVLTMSPASKFILMLRDYPSLLLGHYNFWCHPALDGTCFPGEWYTPGKHTPRTTENFEKLVTDNSRESIWPVLNIATLSYKRVVTELEAVVGRERLLLVSQDDLQRKTKETMDRVFTFLGLAPIDSPKFNVVVNSATSKGEDSETKAAEPGKYGNGLELSAKAREQLVGWWKGDCDWLRDERQVHFSDSC